MASVASRSGSSAAGDGDVSGAGASLRKWIAQRLPSFELLSLDSLHQHSQPQQRRHHHENNHHIHHNHHHHQQQLQLQHHVTLQPKHRLPQGVITPTCLPEFTIPRRAAAIAVAAGTAAAAAAQPHTFSVAAAPSTQAASVQSSISSSSAAVTSAAAAGSHESASDGERTTPARVVVVGGGGGRKLMRSLTVDGACGGGGGGGGSQLPPPPDTNADPGSVAAVSLPHLRTQTSFGFTTVSELPNTRRKESLFLGSQATLGIRSVGRRIEAAGGSRGMWRSHHSTEERSAPRLRQGESRLSLFSKSSGGAEASQQELLFTSPQPSRRLKNPFQRSTSEHDDDGGGCGEGSSDSLASGSDRIGSSSAAAGGASSRDVDLAIVGGGGEAPTAAELQLSLCYDKAYKSLRVRVMRAENLGRPLLLARSSTPPSSSSSSTPSVATAGSAAASDDAPSTYLKLCLMPGKRQRRQSQLVRCASSPVYDEEFFFSSVALDDPGGDALRVRVHSKPGGLRKSEAIGEVVLPLDALGLHLGEELCVWRDVTPVKRASSEPSVLNCVLRFEPRHERLIVNVVDVRNIPRASIVGLPDPFVKVTLSQPQRPVAQKQTRVRPGATNPVFNEAFEFRISPRVDDLAYTTVTFVVCRREKLRGDSVVGAVSLGYSRDAPFQSVHEADGGISSSSSSEISQWSRALQHPYLDVDACHTLRRLRAYET